MSPELIGIGISIIIYIVTFAYFFGGLKRTVDRHDSLLEKLIEKISVMDRDITELKTDVSWLKRTVVAAGHSPKKRTPAGDQIFKDLNGEKYVNEHFEELKGLIDLQETNYRIQAASIDAIKDTISGDKILEFEEYAFSNGWELDDIYQALGLYLRDRILKEFATA